MRMSRWYATQGRRWTASSEQTWMFWFWEIQSYLGEKGRFNNNEDPLLAEIVMGSYVPGSLRGRHPKVGFAHLSSADLSGERWPAVGGLFGISHLTAVAWSASPGHDRT